MLVLTVIEGPDTGRRFELPSNLPQLLGRSSEALPITDNTVSRRHAELTPDAGGWWVRDLSSQNGTWVNGSRIADRTRLRAGDRIRVGASVFLFGAIEAPDDEAVRLVADDLLLTEFEHTLPSNEDSVILMGQGDAAAANHLRVIYRMTTLTAHTMDRAALLNAVMELVFGEFAPERGFIMVRSGDGPFEPAVVRHKSPPKDPKEARINVSRTILQHCIKRGEGVLSTNAMNDPRFSAGDSVQRFKIRSAICSPIRYLDRTFGAIYIDSSIASVSFTPEQLALMNAIGQHAGLALANAELSAQKIHAERLAAMGQTVASLSHSIKNILQGLRGGADLVEMGLKKEDLEVSRNGWSILKRNIDRIVQLTLNMLAFSRQKQIELELTPINALIEEAAQLLEPLCRMKDISLIVDPDPEMPPIPADASLLHQAVMNLLTNAMEAVEPTGGAVTIRTMYHVPDPLLGSQPPYLEIYVVDTGPGIPKDRIKWIFEPFNTTKGGRGTGLGLAVTKRIIDQHHGRIEVISDEGRGSTFKIILPADTGDDLDPSATAETKTAETDPLREG